MGLNRSVQSILRRIYTINKANKPMELCVCEKKSYLFHFETLTKLSISDNLCLFVCEDKSLYIGDNCIILEPYTYFKSIERKVVIDEIIKIL